MKKQAGWTSCGIAAAMAAATINGLTPAAAENRDFRPPELMHYVGLLNDYTPSAAVVKNGPYEMRGKWSLEVDQRRGTATFTAAMNMEVSDYGIAQGSVDKDNPATRLQHTHHIVMTDGVVTEDWKTNPNCSAAAFSPAVTGGFVVTGSAYVTGNGVPAPFGNPSPLTVCVLGGSNVMFSNVTLTFGAPANTHFGKQAIHGVVLKCGGPWERESGDCTVQE